MSDVIAGVPECYFKKNEPKQTKEIQLNINITGSWKCTAEMLHNRGAAILALVQTLQTEQWRVKISLFSSWFEYSKGKTKGCCVQKIDLDTKPLDVSELSLILAHPGFMRRISFAVSETCEKALDLGSYGGGTLNMNEHRLSKFTYEDRTQLIDTCISKSENSLNFMEYVRGDETCFNSPESAANWVKLQIESI